MDTHGIAEVLLERIVGVPMSGVDVGLVLGRVRRSIAPWRPGASLSDAVDALTEVLAAGVSEVRREHVARMVAAGGEAASPQVARRLADWAYEVMSPAGWSSRHTATAKAAAQAGLSVHDVDRVAALPGVVEVAERDGMSPVTLARRTSELLDRGWVDPDVMCGMAAPEPEVEVEVLLADLGVAPEHVALLARLADGASRREVADEFGVTVDQVRGIQRRYQTPENFAALSQSEPDLTVGES